MTPQVQPPNNVPPFPKFPGGLGPQTDQDWFALNKWWVQVQQALQNLIAYFSQNTPLNQVAAIQAMTARMPQVTPAAVSQGYIIQVKFLAPVGNANTDIANTVLDPTNQQPPQKLLPQILVLNVGMVFSAVIAIEISVSHDGGNTWTQASPDGTGFQLPAGALGPVAFYQFNPAFYLSQTDLIIGGIAGTVFDGSQVNGEMRVQ